MRRFTLPAKGRISAQNPFSGRFRFVGEAIAELRKVNWPTKEETKRLTTMVVIVSVAMGAFLGVIDEIYSILMDLILF